MNLSHIALVALSLIGIWYFAHWLKDLYLGDLVTHQAHFTATTKLNCVLLIFSYCATRQLFKKLAFTLVELSIVLVVIGFIIAGIAGAISLTKSAQYLSIISETRQYLTAINNFRSRYNALPGDYALAFNTFGSINGCTNADVNSVSTGCNGNGNGVFNGPEGFRGWQHLMSAQMITGTYDGTSQNVLAKGWSAITPGPKEYYYFSTIGPGWYANKATLNGIGVQNGNEAVSPRDAYQIDLKMDDGRPASGTMTSWGSCIVLAADGVTFAWVLSYAGSDVIYRVNSSTPIYCWGVNHTLDPIP